MTENEKFEQVQAFARVDGAIVALMWVVSFVCAMQMTKNPLFFIGALGVGGVSLTVAALRLKRFRDEVLGGTISYRRALFYSVMTYLYASLLFAGAQYLYFQFIDGGDFVRQQTEMLADPEAQKLMADVYGLTKEDIQFAVDNIGALTPIRIAMQFFTMDVLMGIVVSVPVALLMRRTPRGRRAGR